MQMFRESDILHLHGEEVVGRAGHVHCYLERTSLGNIGRTCNADHPKLAKLLPVPSSMEAHHADIGRAVDTLEVNIPPLVTAEYWV